MKSVLVESASRKAILFARALNDGLNIFSGHHIYPYDKNVAVKSIISPSRTLDNFVCPVPESNHPPISAISCCWNTRTSSWTFFFGKAACHAVVNLVICRSVRLLRFTLRPAEKLTIAYYHPCAYTYVRCAVVDSEFLTASSSKKWTCQARE